MACIIQDREVSTPNINSNPRRNNHMTRNRRLNQTRIRLCSKDGASDQRTS